MSPVIVDDARRWAALRAFTSYLLLVEIRPSLLWARSAHRSRLPATVTAYYAREALNRCLALKSLAGGGQVPDVDEPFFNPSRCAAPPAVAWAMSLVADMAACTDRSMMETLLASTEDFIRSVESDIGLDGPLPSLDGPEGMFPAFSVARESLRLCADAGVPVAMPESWLPEREDTQSLDEA